ncbi:MAG TPA: SpoIID/LytB domain-containing protein [Thermoanaerobaculia bacterium]|nr:SpoIID/LytB domain-containing protein [Thermoanaerobaculia bacterium]
MRLFAVALFSLLPFVAFAQELPSPEELELEEEHIRTRNEHGDSHASGMRAELGPVVLGNPAEAHTLIRVGLSYSFTATGAFSEFATRHHPFAEISHTAGTVHLIDGDGKQGDGKQIVALDVPGTVVRVTRDSSGYAVSVAGMPLGTFAGPLFFRPTDAANQFRVDHIRRSFSGIKVPTYRGAIEISHGSGTEANRLHVVNIVEIEDYVPGVVANESIASFHMEALKAQAVAARGYAIANIGRFRASFPYDIVDSSASQVYRGVISEHPRAVQASAETTGLVASHDGTIIGALYSSSMGGHTDHNEWIFNIPSNQWPGTNTTPYLRGIYDGDGVLPDPTTESGIAAFWTASPLPTIYDDCGRVGNRFSRWRVVLTGAQLRARITPAVPAGVSVTDVTVTRRMTSGRAAIVRIALSNGNVVEVRGWDALRNFFRPAVTTPALCGTSTIPAGMVLNNPSVLDVAKNADGTVSQVTVWGGGWGHNVGMSQYGAHGRARAGQTFLEILKAYYTGVDIGSYPIDIGREPGTRTPTLRQSFHAPNARGTLFVRRADVRKLRIHVNGTYDIALDEAELADGEASVDLSPYLVAGVNTIRYNPVGHGKATVTVAVD